MGYLSKRKFEERERYFIILLLMLIPALTLLGTLGRSLDWRLDYLGEFKLQAAMLSTVLFFWCAFKQRWIQAAVFLLFIILNLALVSSRYHLSEKETQLPPDAYNITILYQNLKGADEKIKEVRRVLETAYADIVLWTNVPVEIYRQINHIKGDYTLQNQSLDKDGTMKLIMARTPGTARGVIEGDSGIWVSRVIGTRKLTLIVTDLDNPWTKDSYVYAEEKIFELADFARSRDEPVVLVGSFGAAGWSYLLKDLENHGGMYPRGKVVLTSSANKPFFLRRPTDLIYTHPGIEATDLESTASIGTDHLGLMATIKIAPIKKEIEFLDLQPTLPEEELLVDPI